MIIPTLILKTVLKFITMSYKANKPFSFGVHAYIEGQEVNIKDQVSIDKLVERKLISKGSGKSQEEVDQERSDELEKQGKENRRLADEASEAEKKRLNENGRPMFHVVDQTKSTATMPAKEKEELTKTGKKK